MSKRLLLPLLFLVSAVLSRANPPSDIRLTTQGHIATIRVEHNSQDVLKHYIYEVKVSLNGKDAVQQSFDRQADPQGQDAVYALPSLKSGDVLTVKASCNRYGSKTKKFTVK